MSVKFSGLDRQSKLDKLTSEEFDILVIGGGITGAGIALDAATRGMKVAVVEMQDFAGGTSSRSTKLVHGGLRYLKQLQIGVVAEVGRERAIVYENGPHVTTPEWMLLPFHKGGTFGSFTTSIGLRVYDFLAQVKKGERRIMLSPSETLKKEPLVKNKDLKGGGYYVEYRTDDARLTIEVMKAAIAKGALAINYVKSNNFIYDDNRQIIGADITDVETGTAYKVSAKQVINAAGPWVDEVRGKDYAKNNKQLRLTKGVHIVFDQSAFPLHQAVYFDTPDKRMVFAIPRDGKTYVGTTDTVYEADKLHPKVNKADRDYIIEAIHYMFPKVNITKDDVESSWSGVRPLIFEKGKDPSEISRKDEIWEAESGLLTIAGGKLTGYRKMAENIVNVAVKRMPNRGFSEKTQTEHLPISGGDVGGSKAFAGFVAKKAKEAVNFNLTEEEGRYLADKYGTNVDTLFAYAKASNEADIAPVVDAQLMYAIEHESVVRPVDFFVRRTGSVFFNVKWAQKWEAAVVAKMTRIFGWTPAQVEEYTHDLDVEIKDSIKPVDED
ncbi:glycerol-3-phosphate dehydrogenase/oxidase [Brochothrix campestris]|uniref:glycerol-3-phosphate dehydrogenase/oxidase n=1 Tax=Brochothrix campestris TaxID=2757 RepID=UPI0038D05AF9